MTVDFFIAVTNFLNISPWSVIYTYRRFGGTCYTYIQGRRISHVVKKEDRCTEVGEGTWKLLAASGPKTGAKILRKRKAKGNITLTP